MKSLRNYIDKIKPQFKKGGKFEKLHSTFDAFETFLFVPDKVTYKGAHIRDAIDMKRTMSVVVFALLPALLFGMFNAGYLYHLSIGETASLWKNLLYGATEIMPIVAVSYITGLAIEFIFAQYRGHEVNEGFLVSGMLIPLILPVSIPLWMVAVSTAFAVVLGKEAFGGTGMNIFNPALLARAFVFFAYPASMSGDKVWVNGLLEKAPIDGFSGATPLGLAMTGQINNIPDMHTLFFGFFPGSIGETSKLAILIGAVILIITGIGSLRIMLSALAGGLAMGFIFNLLAPAFAPIPENQILINYFSISPIMHLLMGGFLFGIVFMATDPVSASQTNTGKIIYGFLVGIFSVMIRVFNPAYPEGVMLAILLMNTFAPLIDHYVVQANISKRLKRINITK